MTTPSIVIPSTSVVLLDSTQYGGPIVVQLVSLKTVGTLTTVRDIGGAISNSKPIILSTVHGVRFNDGTSSFRLTVPFDSVTFQPRTTTSYELLNTFSYPPTLTNTYASSLYASVIIANSSISAKKNIANLDIVSTLNQQLSTLFVGPLVLNNSVTVSTPMSYINIVNAVQTDVGFVRANSLSTNSLTVNTINTDNIDILSSHLNVVGQTFIQGSTIVNSSFTTQLGANVLQVGQLNANIISTNYTRGNIVIQNNLTLPQICTISTVAEQFITDSLFTNGLRVTVFLSSGNILPLKASIQRGSISSISTPLQYAHNISTNLTIYQEYNVSSFFINDTTTGLPVPIWANNSSIYFGKTVISYFGQEAPTLPSSVAGLGTLGYLSSTNLNIAGFSTGQILTQSISTTTLTAPSLVQPIVSTTNIYATNLRDQNLKVFIANMSSVSSYYVQTSILMSSNLNPSQIIINNTRSDSAILNNTSSLLVNASTLNVQSIVSLNTSFSSLNCQTLDSSTLIGSTVNTGNIQLSTLKMSSISAVEINNISLQANVANAKLVLASHNETSTIMTNEVFFNYSSDINNLFFSSGVFYAGQQILQSLDNIVIQIVSTSIGLGSVGYLSSIKWLPIGLSTQQAIANNIFASSLTASFANYNSLYSKNLNATFLQLDSITNSNIVLVSIVTNQGIFSSIIASRIATQNLSLDKGSITGNNFVFNSLTSDSALISTLSANNFITSSITARTANVSTTNVTNLTGTTSLSRIFQGGSQYALNALSARNTIATRTDSGMVNTSSIYAPIVGINTFIPRNNVLFNTRLTASNLIAPTISSPVASIRQVQTSTVRISTIRASTLTLNDGSGTILQITPSNSRIYVNGEWLQLSDQERRNLVSTVGGLGTIPYISSYNFSFLTGLSSFATYVNQASINRLLVTTNQVTSSIATSSLNSLSSGLFRITAQNINLLSSFAIRQIRPALQISENVYIRNWSTGNIITENMLANTVRNSSTIYTNNLSSVNIPIPSLSSLSLTTFTLLVNALTANNMNVNLVSTGSLQVAAITTANTYVSAQISSGLTSASSINANIFSSQQLTSQNLSFSHVSSSAVFLNTASTLLTNTGNFLTYSAYDSNIRISTAVVGGLPISVSSGILFVGGAPIASLSSIQTSLTSTSRGLGSSRYLSSYVINGMSTQFIITSSFSTGTAASLQSSIINTARVSSVNAGFLTTSSVNVASIIAAQANGNVNSANLNTQSAQIQGAVISSINVFTASGQQVFANSSQFINITISSISPQLLTSHNIGTISSKTFSLSSINTQSSNATISSFNANLVSSSLFVLSMNSGQLQTSSIDTSTLLVTNLQASFGIISSLQVNNMQLNYLQLTNTSSVNSSSIVTQGTYANHVHISTTNLATTLLTSQSTNTVSIIASNGGANLLVLPINNIQQLQVSSLSSILISTLSTTVSSANALYLQTVSVSISRQVIASTIITNNPQASTFSFFGNILNYIYPTLYLNNTNVTTVVNANANFTSTGTTGIGIASTVSTMTQNLGANLLNISSNATITSSIFFNTRVTASTLIVPNLRTNDIFILTSLSTCSTLRANTIITSQLSTSSLQYNYVSYSNLAFNSLITSTLATTNLSVSQPLVVSSVGGSSNIVMAAEGAYGLFYNSNPVLVSTFTSSVTTIATNGSIYVAGGVSINSFWGGAALGSTILATSADGLNWAPSAYQGLNQGVNRVLWTGNQFIAVGRGSVTIARSSDGVNWSSVLTSSLVTSVNNVVQGKRGFVGVGIGQGIIRSIDGSNWTSSFTTLSSITAVATNGSLYVAGGRGLATSVDGISWLRYTGSTLINQVNDIGFNGLQFVAVGQDGIATSPDGLTWLNQLSTVQPKQVTWDGIQWLAAAQSSIYFSKDGASWTQQNQLPILTSTFSYTGLSTIVTAPLGTNYVKIQIWGAGGAGGTSTFEPYYIANSQLWLDTSDQTTVLLSTNTSTVQTWFDKSSNASLASTLATALPPAYYSTSIAFTNSTALTSPLYQNQTPFTLSFIGQINSTNTTILNNLTVSSSYLSWQTLKSASQISTNSTLIIGLTTTLSTLTWRINGQQDSIIQALVTSPSTLIMGQGQFQINEAIFFNSNMPTNAVQQVEGYFANKWSTVALLPQQHPYRSMSSIHSGGGGAYIEGIFPLQAGVGSTFGIFTGQGGKFNTSTSALGAYYNQSLYFSTSGGTSYDPSYSLFEPSYFSSLGLWLDGSDPLGNGTKPQDGSQINTWIDKSIQGRSAIGLQGGYYSSGYMYLSSSAYQINYQNFNSTAYTIFTVQLLDNNQGNYQTLLSGGDNYPSLFSGVLSNNIATFTGTYQYNDTNANTPLVDATTWRMTDMLVANQILSPFVDGNAQTQKNGATGSSSSSNELPSVVQNYIGSTQNILVYDSNAAASTIFVNQTLPATIEVYNPDAALSSLAINQMYLDTLAVYYDTSLSGRAGSFSTLFLGALSPTLQNYIGSMENILIYDSNAAASTLFINQTLPTTIEVYNPDAALSTLTINQMDLDYLDVYDPSLSVPSTMPVYKSFTEIVNWKGRVAEVLCFDTALSSKQRQIIEGYLASKWNLQSNLPLNHPYRYVNIYTSSILKGLGGGGAASGILLPNGQTLVAAGGGGGGQGTSWDGGGGGLDIGQRGSVADSYNSYGFSIYGGTSGGGGGGSNQGGQGAIASNGAIGGQGLQGRGGSGGADGWHLALPGGGGGGGFWGGGGGALQASPGGGSSWWRTVAGFVPSFSYSMPALGQGQGQGQGGYATRQGSNGQVVLTFLTVPTTNLQFNATSALQRGYQNIGIGQITLQTASPPLITNSSIMIQSFNSTLVLNNTLYVDQLTNRASIKTAPVSTVDFAINGSITKTAGSFIIPDPSRQGYSIKHCFVESPTAGDTLYRWLFSTVNQRFDYTLPSWFNHLNTDPQVWVQPHEFYQQGRGYVHSNVLSIETTADGLFEVLCVATRKDNGAVDFFKGVEYN